MATRKSLKRHKEAIEFVRDDLPNLKSEHIDWDAASLPTDDYNCMGMAVGVLKWWSPPDAPGCLRNPRDYWPPFIPGDSIDVDAFMEAARTLGFNPCDDPKWEMAFEKIVLFHHRGEFTHAAIQTAPDIWKSKFGNLSDFEHTLDEVTGCIHYGDGRQYMKRMRLTNIDGSNKITGEVLPTEGLHEADRPVSAPHPTEQSE
jgi:hypothetical protein